MPLALGAFIVPLIVACAMFMENVDSTVIVTSLPVIARDFGSDPITLKLAVTSYVIGLGVFIPICGWVADRFGSRTVFRTAIGIFVVGSLMCAASTSLATLVAARFVQGVGGALMVPVGRIIIFRSMPKSEFIRAVNYLTVPALLGPVIGPPIGGFITTYLHWRLIFFINIPVGIVGIHLANKYIANTREPHPGPLDWFGFLLSAGGASAFMLGLALVGSELISDSTAWTMTFAGAIALIFYVIYARYATRPLLDLRFFRVPTFQASVMGGSLFRIGLGAVPFLLPLVLQEGLGMSAFESGLITCASAIGGLFMRTLASRTLHRWGFRTVLMYNAAFSGIAIAACGHHRHLVAGDVAEAEVGDVEVGRDGGDDHPLAVERDAPEVQEDGNLHQLHDGGGELRDPVGEEAEEEPSFGRCVHECRSRLSPLHRGLQLLGQRADEVLALIEHAAHAAWQRAAVGEGAQQVFGAGLACPGFEERNDVGTLLG